MKILYIGPYGKGTTTRMRGETIKKLMPKCSLEVINTHIPFFKTARIFRSLGFRYKWGPLLDNINKYIKEYCPSDYDMIWIDKAIFIYPELMKWLRSKAKVLVHYTPDTAFYENTSRHFRQTISLYDYVISTKTYEKEKYLKLVPPEKFILTIQGFDRSVHYSRNNFDQKTSEVVFIGLCEKARERIVSYLLENKIPVKIGGKGWGSFVRRNGTRNLKFIGEKIFDDQYAEEISKSRYALGLLNKNFPELHTTRTFEIPACGTALLTERNTETTSFYEEDDAIFYDDFKELRDKIHYYDNNLKSLEAITCKGQKAVYEKGYDYESILKVILDRILNGK